MLNEIKSRYPSFSEEAGYNLFESLAWSYFDGSKVDVHKSAYRYMTDNGYPESEEDWKASERALAIVDEIDRITTTHLPTLPLFENPDGLSQRYPCLSVESVSPDYLVILNIGDAEFMKMKRAWKNQRTYSRLSG